MKNALILSFCLIFSAVVLARTDVEKFNKETANSISFTENKGQVSDQDCNPRPDVLFSGETNGLTFYIRDNGVTYQTSRIDSWKLEESELSKGLTDEKGLDSVPDQMTIYRTDINWLGFNKDYTVENGVVKDGFNNYYLPSCLDGAMNVKSYGDVTFKNLYDGIDVKWYEKDGDLEYDFIVAPNSDYKNISWEIQGAARITIGENGQLIIETPLGKIEEQAPIAFQGETTVEAAWKIEGNKISFQLGDFDPNETLIIDPIVRQWGTYYGGTGDDEGNSCATDASGNVYLAGETLSTSRIATTGAHKTTFVGGVYVAFLVKFNSSGLRQWGTYYGGGGSDRAYSCATDANGNVYMAGATQSATGIATAAAHQTGLGGSGSGFTATFLVKFNASGIRQWGTYYGGGYGDYGRSCATDVSGNVYLAGRTSSSTGIATTGTHQTTYAGGGDGFLVKFNSSGVRQWGTYYGAGNMTGGMERVYSCAVGPSGNVYLTGYTNSTTGIATTGAHQTIYGGGNEDVFLVKFNSSGVRQWGTYYGGGGSDKGYSCATDTSGNVYMAAYTESTTGIASIGAHQTNIGGSYDAFLVKFNSSGVRQWGTYYGGGGGDYGRSCATDASGNVYLTGNAFSTTGIATAGAHQTTMQTWWGNAFLVKFTSSGVRQWGSYYGGTDDNYSNSCTTGANGKVYIAGATELTASGIATIGAHKTTYGGGSYDAFLVKFDTCYPLYTQVLAAACNSYTWAANNQVYTSTGVYYTTLTNTAGCDTVVTLNLTINSPYFTQISASFCQGDTFATSGGQLVFVSGIYSDTLQSASSCDSIVETNLSQLTASYDSLIIDTCTTIVSLSGKSYSNTGIYLDTITNYLGCDSIVHYDLTITALNASVSLQNNQLISNEPSASYRWLSCAFNYSVIPNATSQSFVPSLNGAYAVEVSRGACKDTSGCYLFQTVGLIESPTETNSLSIYPNPNDGRFYMKFQQNLNTDFSAEIFSITGVKVAAYDFTKGSNNIQIRENLAQGSYLLKVISDEGIFIKRFVVK